LTTTLNASLQKNKKLLKTWLYLSKPKPRAPFSCWSFQLTGRRKIVNPKLKG
jgi:hypothetical protein